MNEKQRKSKEKKESLKIERFGRRKRRKQNVNKKQNIKKKEERKETLGIENILWNRIMSSGLFVNENIVGCH